jgi:hypothetical protein
MLVQEMEKDGDGETILHGLGEDTASSAKAIKKTLQPGLTPSAARKTEHGPYTEFFQFSFSKHVSLESGTHVSIIF